GGGGGVGEHAPVVEEVGLAPQVGDDLVPATGHRRQVGVVHRRVLAVPGHRHHLTVLGPAVQGGGVPVVPGRPVTLGDLVAQVTGPVVAGDAEQPPAPGAHLVLVAVHHRADQRPDV